MSETPHPSPGVELDEAGDFGDDWEPDRAALRIATQYLLTRPEQGEWDYEDHWQGIAGGILHALHRAGFDLAATSQGEDECLAAVQALYDVAKHMLVKSRTQLLTAYDWRALTDVLNRIEQLDTTPDDALEGG